MINLSIIIPNFNSGALLDLTLESIYKEGVLLDFEVLVMDNCSTDYPEWIINKYQFENLHFFSEPDLGVYDAMNKGVKIARGVWIYFIGAGDRVWLSNICKIASVEFFNYYFIYGNSKYIKTGAVYDGKFDSIKLLNKNISHQAIVYKREVIEFFGFFDLRYKVWADYFLNLQIFFSCPDKIKYVDCVFSEYLGGGLSDKNKDLRFSKEKNLILCKLFFKYPSRSNFITLIKYYYVILKIKFFYV